MSWIGLKSFIKSFSEFYCSELEINLVKLYFAVDSIKIKILFSIISQWEGETATVQSTKWKLSSLNKWKGSIPSIYIGC